MAEDLAEWFEDTFDRLNVHSDVEVSVISVIGKESAEHSKCEVLNVFFDDQIFGEMWCSTNKRTYIEAYFSPEYSAIFLVLHGMNDLTTVANCFSEEGDSKNPPNFYEQMARLEEEYNQYAHFLFLISHIVLFVDPGCRFDVSFAKTLSTLNQLRKNRREELCSALADVEGVPESVVQEGRFAVPRLLFLFDRNPLRTELGAIKKKELLEKMQNSIERQIIAILRTYKIIVPQLRSSVACVSDDRFVHVNGHYGWTVDTAKDVIYENSAVNRSEGPTDDERKLQRAIDDFEHFLLFHLEHGPEELDDELVFANPTVAEFLLTARELYRLLITEHQVAAADSTIPTELRLTKALDAAYEDEAFFVYVQHGSVSGQSSYSRALHEQKLTRAKAYLQSNYTGSNLTNVVETLTKRCVKEWECENRPCAVLSINGNPCSLPVHNVPGGPDADGPQRQHSNAVHYMSCCTCGKSQALRPDPFTIREANYEFYEHPNFKCCRFLERHNFELFDPQSASAPSSDNGELSDEEDDRHSIDRVDFRVGAKIHQDSYEEEDDYLDSDDENLYHLRRSLSQTESESEEISKESDEGDLLGDNKFSAEDEEERASSYISNENDQEEDSQRCSSANPETTDDNEHDVEDDAHGIKDNEHEVDNQKISEDEEEVFPKKSGTSERAATSERKGSTPSTSEGKMSPTTLKLKKGSYLDDEQPITFRNPTPVTPWSSNAAKHYAIEKKFRGRFLETMPHSSQRTHRLPLFPSWNCICLGSSSLYSHNIGMRDQPSMRAGSEFLLPLDVILPVNGAKWDTALAELNITNPATFKHKRRIIRLENGLEQEVEKVKLFIGFDYECSRGHRFMLEAPGTVMKHSRRSGQLKGSATELLASDLPIWMPCPCKKTPNTVAQLMRIHVITPKAPVAIHLEPKVQAIGDEDYFTLGEGPIQLSLAKYYILRFPFCYVGPNGPIRPPTYPVANATLLKNCLTIVPSY
uniref:Nonsense-mediated mRNA decay factor SMG8 n=1 Tax=Steinernema glaseri TaxID=37863 RepID=A0A1I7XYP3_9BILA